MTTRLHWSTLRHVAVSPRALRWYSEHPPEETPAMRLGTLVHRAILQPETLRLVVRPEGIDRRTRDGKAAYADWLASVEPADEQVDGAESDAIARMVASVTEHPVAGRIVAEARAAGQVEVYREWHSAAGTPCAGTADIATDRIVDIKTHHYQMPEDFIRAASRRLYYGQVAWYSWGFGVDAAPQIIAVQSVPPWETWVFTLTGDAYARGLSVVWGLLARYESAVASGKWPGADYDSELAFEVPRWMKTDAEKDEEAWNRTN